MPPQSYSSRFREDLPEASFTNRGRHSSSSSPNPTGLKRLLIRLFPCLNRRLRPLRRRRQKASTSNPTKESHTYARGGLTTGGGNSSSMFVLPGSPSPSLPSIALQRGAEGYLIPPHHDSTYDQSTTMVPSATAVAVSPLPLQQAGSSIHTPSLRSARSRQLSCIEEVSESSASSPRSVSSGIMERIRGRYVGGSGGRFGGEENKGNGVGRKESPVESIATTGNLSFFTAREGSEKSGGSVCGGKER